MRKYRHALINGRRPSFAEVIADLERMQQRLSSGALPAPPPPPPRAERPPPHQQQQPRQPPQWLQQPPSSSAISVEASTSASSFGPVIVPMTDAGAGAGALSPGWSAKRARRAASPPLARAREAAPAAPAAGAARPPAPPGARKAGRRMSVTQAPPAGVPGGYGAVAFASFQPQAVGAGCPQPPGRAPGQGPPPPPPAVVLSAAPRAPQRAASALGAAGAGAAPASGGADD